MTPFLKDSSSKRYSVKSKFLVYVRIGDFDLFPFRLKDTDR